MINKDDTKDYIDESNKTDETNTTELELTKAKLALGDLKPLRPLKPTDLYTAPDTPIIQEK